jgi:hypothetical protein
MDSFALLRTGMILQVAPQRLRPDAAEIDGAEIS